MAHMIESHRDIAAYFHECIEAACEAVRPPPNIELRHYLLELLRRFMNARAARHLGGALALQMAQAEEQTGAERLRSLRDLGDGALFVCGFWPESVERRGLPLDYAMTMGGRAYARTGDLASREVHWVGPTPQLFRQLADAFETMVRVLDDVRQQTALRTRDDILALYERWWHSRSPRLAERLRAQGVVPHALGGGSVN